MTLLIMCYLTANVCILQENIIRKKTKKWKRFDRNPRKENVDERANQHEQKSNESLLKEVQTLRKTINEMKKAENIHHQVSLSL